jgi:hypothetical protein
MTLASFPTLEEMECGSFCGQLWSTHPRRQNLVSLVIATRASGLRGAAVSLPWCLQNLASEPADDAATDCR